MAIHLLCYNYTVVLSNATMKILHGIFPERETVKCNLAEKKKFRRIRMDH